MKISISLKNNNEAEQITKKLLERILEKYKLDGWVLCQDITIEQGASGKAFPLIRLSAHDNEDKLLAQFLHEQIHWIEKGREGEMESTVEELKNIFPNVPINKPEGGGNQKSTYIHLIICRLEFLALKAVLGEEKAQRMVSSNNNYTWIRKIVIDNGSVIDSVIKRYFLDILKH